MRILHTADWHLGRNLYSQKRDAEFEAFLAWLLETLEEKSIGILFIAGDIFDTGTPGTRSQRQYYDFLAQVGKTGCRHVVVTGGNHDSPSLLNAPAGLLKSLNVHVVGQALENPADEVLLLRDAQGRPECIVAAVPYLRDSDLRKVEPGESAGDKEQKIKDGIREHYRIVGQRASELRKTHGEHLPIFGMGHLFAAGGKTTEGDGTRDLYVGNLGQVGLDAFPDCFDYLALGHLHVPQRVGGSERHRYSGSPLPMNFGEAAQQKEVLLIDMPPGGSPGITPLPIPRFQRLEAVKGDLETLRFRLQTLADSGEDIWVEVQYTGDTHVTNLRSSVAETVQGSRLQVLRVQDRQQQQSVLQAAHVEETLDHLKPEDVFQRCLTANRVADSEQADLRALYAEVLFAIENPETTHGDPA